MPPMANIKTFVKKGGIQKKARLIHPSQYLKVFYSPKLLFICPLAFGMLF